MYSDLYLKKRPTLLYPLVSVVMVGLVSFITFFYVSNNSTPTRASKNTLKKHEIVNVSSNQVGIFWQTQEEDEGYVLYGTEDKLNQIAIDEQDIGNKRAKRQFHYVLLKNLQPDSVYYYKIVSNKELIANPQDDAFTLRTSRNYNLTSLTRPVYGNVVLPSGEPAKDAIVLLYYKNSRPFLAFTKISGEWLITLQAGVDKTTNESIAILEKEPLTIEIISNNSQSTIKAIIENTNPIPQTIIMGKNYEFLEKNDNILPAFTKRNVQDKDYKVDITYPKEGAIIPGLKPLIKGRGVPYAQVIVNINSDPEFSALAIVDEEGDWRVSMPSSILPGTYRLVVTTDDVRGQKVGFRRRFTLAKSGEVVLGEATGPGTLTPSPTAEPSPTSGKISSIPSPSPTQGVTQPSPTAVFTYNPTSTPVPPTSGINNSLSYVVTGITLVIVGVGVVLLF